MTKIIGRRLLMLLLVLFCVSLGTFLMSNVMPGDPAQVMAGPHASQETVQSIRHQMGMDKPLPEQYWDYMVRLGHGDLGKSITTQHPVSEDLEQVFPATLELIFYAFVVALLVGIPLAVLAAVRPNSWFDRVASVLSLGGISMPLFWLGLVLILVFYGKLGMLPSSGRLGATMPPPPHITGLYTIDGVLTNYWGSWLDAVKHLVLPVLSLAYVQLAIVVRQLRASMIDVLALDYVRTARAAGLAPHTVIIRFGLRNALVPMLTVIGVAFGSLLGGAVVTETVFGWPGMGNYVVNAIATLDFPAIMGATLVIAVAYVLLNLLVDLINIYLNPVARYGGSS
ncbi:MAG: ABC transporter permease [Nocardioidaceae bacterium]